MMPDGKWGIAPFFIERTPVSPSAVPRGPAFEFRAPTAARNAMRILRALQLPKAVLLEGSPGVGKSSIVAAMARAAGDCLQCVDLQVPCNKHLVCGPAVTYGIKLCCASHVHCVAVSLYEPASMGFHCQPRIMQGTCALALEVASP